ncbi:MAG TPA: beta-galactosidase, partial [Candidatus Glassbacteria bacterium]|nr:beta-galactosidase [Candidatus Glassbacteria bacterium]
PATASVADPRDCRVQIRNRFTFPALYGPPEKIKTSRETERLRVRAQQAMAGLEEDVKAVELQGYQPYYWKIPLITAQIGLDVRSKLVWFQTEDKEREILEYVIASCDQGREKIRKLLAADDPERVELPEDEVNPHILYVPPYPVLKGLKQKDGFFRDESGRPVIIFSVLTVNEGPLMDYFAPFNHRLESYTVGGGSRYDVESSPVYEAFHKYPDTHRVGWDGWCGHLVKDRWSMGGRKESVVICLENPHIRDAVFEYTKSRYDLWKRNPNLLYNIMAYELMYICYCETSQQMFRDWLRAKYGSVAALNAVWGTSYRSLAEITAPETKNAAPLPEVNRAAWYDWATFNARRFTDYLRYCKAQIRRLDPDVPITAGGTSSMLSAANSTSGIDEEQIINEVDDVILNESGHSHIFSDLFLSLAERKIPMVEPEMGGHPHGTLLHFLKGKSSVAKWWWARTPSLEYHGMNESSLPHGWDISLEDVAEVLRIGLDVRRLAPEIAAFSEPEPEIAILYSQSSIVQVPPQLHRAGRTPYLEALHATWEGSRFLGCRIGFVTERQIAHGKLASFKLLIVPAAKYIQPETVNRILAFVDGGGVALVVPESFLFDQYARPGDRTADLGLKVTDVILPQVLGEGELVQNYDQSFTQTLVYGEVEREISPGQEDIFAGRKPAALHSTGLVQKIDPGTNKVLATFTDGSPALVLVQKGAGRVYYLAAPLVAEDYHRVLELLAERLGVQRPLLGIASDGGLVTGAEVRAVERPDHYLMYASNLSADKIEFDIRGKAYEGEVTDLRSLGKVPEGHVALNPWQETIYRIDKQKMR